MTKSMADFPDVNVWVALTAEDHVHHIRAETYWRTEADERLSFCRTTVLGLVRVTSQQRTFGGHPLAPLESWECYFR
jgi:predicted nucleic acid-binding protein